MTRQTKPNLYPDVEDDATIVLDYKDKQVVIQASWDWSHNRKEMEVFGRDGYIKCRDGKRMSVLFGGLAKEKQLQVGHLKNDPDDPFQLFKQVVDRNKQLSAFDVSSLANNFIVMQILEAAKKSAVEKRTVRWSELYD